MCGIAGILRFDGAPVDGAVLQAMTDALAHRGPDGQGVFVQGPVGLGHRRLAIIDVAGSPQPMQSSDSRYVITYNGELYNFRELREELQARGAAFRTQGDTEVILAAFAAWGPDCVKRFRGMFAFCIADLQGRTFMLARDHFGIKPLFYARGHGSLAFASEINALRRVPGVGRRAQLARVEEFLRFQYVPGAATIFEDIRALEPASVMHGALEDRQHLARKYWSVEFKPEPGVSHEQWIERADAVIRDSVRAHLVSDVPVGAFISGGVDSSLVAWKVHELGAGPRFAFCMGFDDSNADELPYSRQVAAKLGVELRTGVAREDFWDELPRLVAHFGQPFGDSSMIPTWQVAALARRDVKVVLSGDAGDEGFAGYDTYVAFNALPGLRERLRRLRRSLGRRELAALVWALGRRLGLRRPRREEWVRAVEYVGAQRRRAIWRPEFRAIVDHHVAAFDDSGVSRRELTAYAQAMDFRTYLPGCVLTKVDMATMFHGLEARTPLLDVEVLKLAQALPEDERMRRDGSGPNGKAVLKDLLARLMGPEFAFRRKQGFGIPRRQWFLPGRKGRELFEAVLGDSASGLGEWFDLGAVRAAAAEHTESRDRSGVMWLLLVLGLWRQQNRGVSFE